MSRDSQTRTDAPPTPSNVLLTAPREGDRKSAACSRLLGNSRDRPRHVLGVTYGTAPSRWHAQVVGETAGNVADSAVISVGDLTRAAASGSDPDAGPPGVPSVRTIGEPTDLVGLGLELEDQLTAWEGSDAEAVVCLDSVTDLLAHVDAESARRFLNRLTEVVAASDARAHYHFDPASHDDRTVAAVRSVFETELDLREDGVGGPGGA
ncbi:hypothetical protein GCM10027435_21860 [Haloparvum alkalitolerans]|uniref:DUF7504 family protein n=1 Tax=Haloparvum alkalitolerans TaxID=1042953 RepID=UPI003CF2372F